MNAGLRFVAAVLVGGVLLTGTSVRAALSPAIQLTSADQATGDGDRTLGFTFTPTETLVVSELGLFDLGTEGLAGSHEVGIFLDSAGAAPPIVQTTINGTEVKVDNYYWEAVTPTTLTAGVSYTIGALANATDGYDDPPYVGLLIDPRVGYVGSRFSSNSGVLQRPTSVVAPLAVFALPNFNFSPIPEPSGLALLAAGVAGVVRRRASGRRHRAR